MTTPQKNVIWLSPHELVAAKPHYHHFEITPAMAQQYKEWKHGALFDLETSLRMKLLENYLAMNNMMTEIRRLRHELQPFADFGNVFGTAWTPDGLSTAIESVDKK